MSNSTLKVFRLKITASYTEGALNWVRTESIKYLKLLILMFDSKFEFINIQKLVKQKTPLPSPFYCSLHPFKFIPYHTNPPGLWWPLPFIYLAAQPPPPSPSPLLIIAPTIRYMIVIIYLYFNLCTYLFRHLCERKKSFITFPPLILYFKLQTSISGRFDILALRVLGGWVCNLGSFWRRLWEDSICQWRLMP